MKSIILLLTVFTGTVAFAAGGGNGGIPSATVLSQIINLCLLVAILYFWQGKNISKAFKDKKDSFLQSVEEASRTKTEAENKMKEVKERVAQLKANYASDVEGAKKNAEEGYRTQLADAKNEAERIKTTAGGSLESEVQKEIENLRVEAFKKSAGMAEEKMAGAMSSDQQKAWNNHFASEVQGVQ